MSRTLGIWKNLPKELKLTNYLISNTGIILNKKTCRTTEGHKHPLRKGRTSVQLTNDENSRKNYYIHRLVALTYLNTDDNENKVVDHIDRNPLNNSIDNLRWVTVSENNKNADRTNSGLKRKVILLDEKDEEYCTYFSAKLASIDLNVDHSTILKVCKGKRSHVQGYKFKFHNKDNGKEIWKKIELHDTHVEVSSFGRVKYNNGHITEGTNCNGYKIISVGNKNTFVHRLVLLSHVPHINSDNLSINHIDRNKHNNRLDNLEWTTIKENNRHAHCKKVVQLTTSGNIVGIHNSLSEAQDKTQIDRRNIGAALKTKSHISGGFKWILYQDYNK